MVLLPPDRARRGVTPPWSSRGSVPVYIPRNPGTGTWEPTVHHGEKVVRVRLVQRIRDVSLSHHWPPGQRGGRNFSWKNRALPRGVQGL